MDCCFRAAVFIIWWCELDVWCWWPWRSSSISTSTAVCIPRGNCDIVKIRRIVLPFYFNYFQNCHALCADRIPKTFIGVSHLGIRWIWRLVFAPQLLFMFLYGMRSWMDIVIMCGWHITTTEISRRCHQWKSKTKTVYLSAAHYIYISILYCHFVFKLHTTFRFHSFMHLIHSLCHL